MYRLRRLYFDSIGVADNRLSDLTVDLTDGAGNPVDSIVWLRNGAGKTTMLSLLLALILPDRRDFLATRVNGRTLEDLVLGPDTSHVVAEWVDAGGRLLLTGAVYEWDGRVRPRDHNSAIGRSRFRRMWWCVTPDDAVPGSDLETLPFTLRTRGEVDIARFRSHVRDLAAAGANATAVDDNIGNWHAALGERRFDPELFRYFAEVNSSEGGIDKLFSNITSPGAFVRHLLRFVGDERRAEPVRNLLSETAVEIAKRPTYLAERDFCSESVPRLVALGDAHARVVVTTGQLGEIRDIAAAYKRALLEAAGAAERSALEADDARGSLDAQARDTRVLADTARRHRDEYLRLGAVFRLDVARAASATAVAAAAKATLRSDAWRAVPDVLTAADAAALVEDRRQAITAAAAGAGPLAQRVEEARARLAATLDAAISDADGRISALAAEAANAAGVRDDADQARQDARDEGAKLDNEATNLADAITRFDRNRTRATDAGALAVGETPAAAARRLRGTVEQLSDAVANLESEQDALAGRRTRLAARAEELRARATTAGIDTRALHDQLGSLQARADRIADEPRVRDLLQADDVDVFAEVDDLGARLRSAIASADADILRLRAEQADDERALHALEVDGLLPPRPAVEAVVAALNAHGVSAFSGWRYLTENVAATDHRRVIESVPGAVDGVVVYGDAQRAAQAIDGLVVDELVVISPAAAFAGGAAPSVVVGPALAQYDRSAAAAELDRRRDAVTVRAAQVAALSAQRSADVTLADKLGALIADVPDDGMVGLRRRAAAAAVADDEARAAAEQAVGAVTEIDERIANLHTELRSRAGELSKAEAHLERAAELADEDADIVGPARARLDVIPNLVAAAAEAEAAASARWADADASRERFLAEARGLVATKGPWVRRRPALGAAAGDGGGITIDAAEDALAAADELLRERFPEAALRQALREAEAAAGVAAARVDGHRVEVVSLATELAASPAAADVALRSEAEGAARTEAAGTAAKVGAAESEKREAEAELERVKPPADRARHAQDLPLEPEDRDDALRRAAAANGEATTYQLQYGQLERERDAAAAVASGQRHRSGMLRDQSDRLPGVEPAESGAGDVPEDDDDVRAAVAELAADLEEARNAYGSAASGRSQRIDQLRTWAGADRFRAVAEDEHGQAIRRLRGLFTAEDVVERVAPRARDLADDLADRERAIAQQLSQVEAHKHNVVVRLADLVEDALADLARASNLSELPADIGPWGGLRFLAVEPRQRPTHDQVAVRVDDVVDRMVAAGKVELDPIELLWQATDAAVADGFRATILKPAPDQPTHRIPVEDMRKWSGGENLTASLVLFCVMAKLRAEKRTGTRSGTPGGFIPLDNPLGKANYLPFLELQRKVAAANDVQLVFWTGIGDIGAVTAFPRIAAMHKRPSAATPGRAYVRNDDDASTRATVSIIDALRRG